MSLVKGRNGNKPRNRNRMHPNEARIQEEDYYSSAAYAKQQEASEMAALSIQHTQSKEEITMSNEQPKQDVIKTPVTVEVNREEAVTKPSSTRQRVLPPRQPKPVEEIVTPPTATEVPVEEEVVVTISVDDGESEVTVTLSEEEFVDDSPEEDVITIDEVVEEVVRKRTIPETRSARPSMLPPKVEPSVKVAPKGYVDAGDHYERKVEASILGVTASVTMTKPKPSSAGLIFEGRIDLEEAEGVQFWRPIFNRKLTPDDHVPAHYVPVIVQAARFRNSGLFDPVYLIAINCTVGDMNDPGVEICSDTDGTVITFKEA